MASPAAHAAVEAAGYGVAAQSDGKFVAFGAAGATSVAARDFGLARFGAGVLDTSFGTGGRSRLAFGSAGVDEAKSGAVLPGGRIIVAGTTQPAGGGGTGQDFAVARYYPDGTVDGSFGVGGSVTTHWGTADQAEAVALQADGKAIVAGGSQASLSTDFALARYNADGTPDDGTANDSTPGDQFGTSAGKVRLDVVQYWTDRAFAVAVQSDGKIVAAGAGNGNFAVIRLNANGSLDDGTSADQTPSDRFGAAGAGGKVITDVTAGAADQAEAVVIEPDGQIVVAGWTTVSVMGKEFAVVRYNANGSLDDGTFADQTPLDRFGALGAGGKVITAYSGGTDEARTVALSSDGHLYVGGTKNETFQGFNGPYQAQTFAVMALRPDGTAETAFGGTGHVVSAFLCGSPTVVVCPSHIEALAVQSTGEVAAVGRGYKAGGGADAGFAVASYTPTGGASQSVTLWDGVTAENTTTARAPETPVVQEPTSGTLRGSGARYLRWSSAKHARNYDVYFDGAPVALGVIATDYTVANVAAGSHTWYVVAKNAAGTATSLITGLRSAQLAPKSFGPFFGSTATSCGGRST